MKAQLIKEVPPEILGGRDSRLSIFKFILVDENYEKGSSPWKPKRSFEVILHFLPKGKSLNAYEIFKNNK